ncbi:MAG: hypothetical protein ACI94Y_001512 [Maribacter sp.]|jgi:hypothetical protein
MATLELLYISIRSPFVWIILGLLIYYSTTKIRIPLNKRMPKDMLRLKAKVSHFLDLLIPWKREEIELLSLNRTDVKNINKGGFESTGAFESIYQEPVFSYGYKEYSTKDYYAVIYAQTKNDELFYYEYPKETEVQVNGVTLGRLIDGKLYGNDGSMLANFLDNALESYTAVIIGNKDVGHVLRKGSYNNDVNPRALDLVSDEMTREERIIFLAMIVHKLVKTNVID